MPIILIAENETTLRESLSEILNEYGFETITAADGYKALNLLHEKKPSLILSDIRMPHFDGYEFLKFIKESATYANIPFIFLSGISDRKDIRYAMNLGADDYLLKPYSISELINSIESNLKKYVRRNQEINFIKNNILKYIPHELRTPLVSILGMSELLTKNYSHFSEPEVVGIAAQINRSGLRLYNTIDKFLLLTELLSEHFSNKEILENIPIKEAILEILNQIQIPEERKKDLCVEIELSEIRFSRKYLSIVIKELVHNAIKFSRKNSPIEINGIANDSYYLLEIKDYGRGMSKTELLDIDSFKQFNRDEFQQEGNGLGLAIVKQIMNNTNCKLSIDSEYNHYTKINLQFNLAKNNHDLFYSEKDNKMQY